ncbi:MAG: type IX secretion system membrane protein PorP/SprF [Chryseolinea sp.]
MGYANTDNGLSLYGSLHTTITSVSYNVQFSDRITFEPIVTYRTYDNTDGQFEGLGVLRIDNLAWVGGSYRQDYGATAFVGMNIKDKIKLGYAYEFATDQINALGDGTHEVQLVLRLGKKKFSKPQSNNEGQSKQPDATENEREEAQPKEDIVEKEVAAVSSEESPREEIVQQPAVKQPEQTLTPIDSDPKKEAVKSLSGNSLLTGHYVVVGAFLSVENAKSYMRTLKRTGYPADVAFHSQKQYYIVHMNNASTIEEARHLRDKYRQMSHYSFRDTWILSIE